MQREADVVTFRTGGRRRRSALFAAALTVAVGALGAPAAAERVVREAFDWSLLQACGTETALGRAEVILVWGSTRYAEVGIWEPGTAPGEAPARYAAQGMTVTADGPQVSATGTLLDTATGEAVAPVSMAFTVTGTGEVPARFSLREGNRLLRVAESIEELAAAGVLSVGGNRGELACSGERHTGTARLTQPHGEVGRDSVGAVYCEVVAATGERLVLEGSGRGLSAGIFDAAGELVLTGYSDDHTNSTITRSSMSASLLLTDEGTGKLAGEAVVDAAVTPVGDKQFHRFALDPGRLMVVAEALALAGTLTLPDGTSFDLGGCEGVWLVFRWEIPHPARRS